MAFFSLPSRLLAIVSITLTVLAVTSCNTFHASLRATLFAICSFSFSSW